MSEEAWISFWESIITTVITFFVVYLAYWLYQTREKDVKFTKTVFEPLHIDIREITNLANKFDYRRSPHGTGEYAPEYKSKTWTDISTKPNLNLKFLNATKRRKRDIMGFLQNKDLKKEIEDFYKCFEKYQNLYEVYWPVVKGEIEDYLGKQTTKEILNEKNIKTSDSLISNIIDYLKEEDKKKRYSRIGSEYGITKIDIIEEMIEEIKAILDKQDIFQEMISLKNELSTRGDTLINELIKRMVY